MPRLITSSNSAKVPGDLDALANAARSSRPTPPSNEDTTASNDRDVVRLSVVLRLFELPFHSSFRANVWSGLYLCKTAIDEQLGPCDITRIIGGEKHDSSCDLIRGPESAERNDV